ncbi:hypothetical protein [Streptomyces sp. N35]|uniref:hypothetical protein n=1 Tax=Streptomyces sp. N35 TaxID=2795730 RepID=UPI0018F3E4B0|nr:hypothetical protein [Streptomyces sp. N35]
MDLKTAHRTQILTDMHHAQSLELADLVGYLATYGQTLQTMATQYDHPTTALRWLRRYADNAYTACAQICH